VRGFTLLEVMVALAIMAGVILTVISSLNYHLSLTAHDNEEAVALLLARVKLEELELLEGKNLGETKEGTFAPERPDYSWKAELSSMPVAVFKTLTVTVTWGPDRRSLSLEHYLVQKK
jgi:general secretion pathway protein I